MGEAALALNFAMQSYMCMMPPRVVMDRLVLLLALGAALLVAGACDKQRSDSPLIQAARTGSLDTITLLLDSGADVNLAGPTGDDWDATPLQHAILARQPGAVRLLLDRGADPNRVGSPNAPAPLLLAAGDTDPTFVNLLLAHGANPAIEGESGVTPLSRAVSAGTINGPDRPMFGGCRVETVGALPEVWGRAEIDWRVADYAWNSSGEWQSRPWWARAAPTSRLRRPAQQP